MTAPSLAHQALDQALAAGGPARAHEVLDCLLADHDRAVSTGVAVAALRAQLLEVLDACAAYFETVPPADRTPALRRLAGTVHTTREGLALRHAHHLQKD